jgi:magnesium and cobalt transporter
MSFLTKLFANKIITKKQVRNILSDANKNNVVDNDLLNILESALHLDELNALDIMIPRNQIDVIDINENLDAIMLKIIRTGHSRFPVIDGDISQIIGVFHSKDLVHYILDQENFEIRNYVRKMYFIPDVKRLDTILYEMKQNHIHLALVVDEFTNIVGLITLEMVIEQIIGEIDDEYDAIEGDSVIIELSQQKYRVKGVAKLMEINNKFKLNLDDKLVETISGYIVKKLGRVPKNGEIVNINNINFEIISADKRKISLILVDKNGI